MINYQKWKWKKPSIVVKFTKINPGISISIWGNEGDVVTTKSLLKEITLAPQLDTDYEVDAKRYNMVIVAHPKKGNPFTDFEFTF